MSTHRLIQVAAVGIVFAGAYLVIRSAEPTDASQQPDEVPIEANKEVAKKPPVELKGTMVPKKKKEPKPVVTSNQLLLPDGTTVPVLNGAFGAPELGWPDHRPWSPIVSKATDEDGDEWYVHEDGSRSITKNLYHAHLKGMAPVTSVYNPTKPLPIDPTEAKLDKERHERDARKKAKDAAKKKANSGNGQKK